MLEAELQNEAKTVEEENRRQKIKTSMYRAYINKLQGLCRQQKINADIDIDAEWAKIKEL